MRFRWVATYSDGTCVRNITPKGETLFKDIDQSRLVKFGWYAAPKGVPSFEVALKTGDKLVAFRRHHASVHEDKIVQYGLGIDGRFLMLIGSDGSVEVE